MSCSNVQASLGMLVSGEGDGDEKWAVPLQAPSEAKRRSLRGC